MTTTTTTPPQGRDWLTMSPAHFDASLLPRKHRKPETGGLFSVADVAPEAPRKPAASAPELDGQLGLFGTGET